MTAARMADATIPCNIGSEMNSPHESLQADAKINLSAKAQ